MKTHTINIDTKYFEPIRNGEITLLLFDKKIFDPETTDYIEARRGEYSVLAGVEECYIKSFAEVTDEEATAAGFLNRDFLKDELIRRFKIDTLDQLLNTIDEYLFFFVKVSPYKKNFFDFKSKQINVDDVDFFTNTTDMDLYETSSELYDMWRYDE